MQISSATAFNPLAAAEKKKQAEPAAFFAAPEAPVDPIKQKLLDYAQMTPAEKIRASILDSMGLKEEDLANMDPKMREAIELKIKEAIQQQVELGAEKKGVYVDLKA